MENILNTDDFGAQQKPITELGKNTVYFLPYLMGERSPHNDPQARGAFLGLSLDTHRHQLTQAVFEGVAFALQDCYQLALEQGIRVEQTSICGGRSQKSSLAEDRGKHIRSSCRPSGLRRRPRIRRSNPVHRRLWPVRFRKRCC